MEETIYLRALEPEDLDFLYEMENNPRVWKEGNTNVPYSRQVLLDYVMSASADIYVDKQVRMIVEDEHHRPVGIVDLVNFDPRHLRAELGIVIKEEYRGKGFAQRSVARLLDYAKDILHLHQVYAIVNVKNIRAAKMIERVGFQTDKTLKEWIFNDGTYDDAYLFQYFL